MLKSWAEYYALTADNVSVPEYVGAWVNRPEWLTADAAARLVTLNDSTGLWAFPAYAQMEYVYEGHTITKVDETRYHHTPTLERVNQFDAMGAAYDPRISAITMEYRLACITRKAGEITASERGMMRADGTLTNGALMVIDGLRTVDATYLLAAANPLALENRLLALPGRSAHNKGMAVDLTLVYEGPHGWCDVDMLGHIDHADMVTNHRNYDALSDVQRHNRLYLEQVMLRGAFASGMLLAPLREEFWDFRFPEDGLDLWRVLEAVARAAGVDEAWSYCSAQIDAIHTLLRAGQKTEAYTQFSLDDAGFASKCDQLFATPEARDKLQTTLHTTPETLAELAKIYHGGVGLVFDAILPEGVRQVNPELAGLFLG